MEVVKDYRPMADCEKTSRLIGFADVLPMIGLPLFRMSGFELTSKMHESFIIFDVMASMLEELK